MASQPPSITAVWFRTTAGGEAECQSPDLRHDSPAWRGLPVLGAGGGGDEEGHPTDEEPRGRWTGAGGPDGGRTGGCRALHGVTGYIVISPCSL